MAISNESNFPNSRITASIQGIDTAGNLKAITTRSINDETGLSVYILGSSSGSGTDVNIAALGGIGDFSIGHPMIKKDFDKISIDYSAQLFDDYKYYKNNNLLYTIRIYYSDNSKEVITQIERL